MKGVLKAGMLRILSADVLARLLADPDYCLEPVNAPVMEPIALPENRSETLELEGLPNGRALTASDRILLCGSLDQAGLNAIAGSALACGTDVWVLPAGTASQALAVIDRLAITLCHWPPGNCTDDAQLVCVDATGERLTASRTGWLIEPGESLTTALSAGYVDPRGWIHVLGALRNCLPAEQGLLTPFEAVARLESHELVTQACVLAIQDDSGADSAGTGGVSTESPLRFFAIAETAEPSGPVLEVALLGYLRRGLSAVKCPQGILLVQSLPRHADAVPDAAALAKLVAQEASSAAGLPVNTDL